ncbi:MAG: polysaccharide biosynthesis tyrosine autokinase [Verrucomicrobiota bacterium]
MKSPTSTLENEKPLFSIGDIIAILRYRWLPGLAVGLVLAAAFAFWKMQETPIYKASATVMAEMNRDRVLTNMEDVVDPRAMRLDIAINTHFERLRSQQFAEQVAEELSETQIQQLVAPYLNPDNPEQVPNPIGVLRRSFSVSSRSGSQVLVFSGTHPNPQVAAWVPNLFAETYIRYLTALRASSSEIAITFLEEQVEAARKDVEAGEQVLQDYRRENNLISIEENQQVVSLELQGLNEALNSNRIRLVTLQSQLAQIESAGTDPTALSKIPALVDNEAIAEVVANLDRLSQERDILSQRYLERHPKMVANANEVSATLRQLEAAAKRRQTTLQETQKGTDAEIAILLDKIADVENRARELDQLAIQYTVREREVQSKRRTYERLIDRLNETQVTTQLDTTVLRIMDEATPPGSPISPSLRNTITTATIIFLICLIGIPIGLEFLDNRIRTFMDIDRVLKKPLLGEIREIENAGSKTITRGVLDEKDEILESFRNIYSNLHLKDDLPSSFAMVVTSTIPSEGKTFVAANLGEIFSRHGKKVILIDTDLRRPSLAGYLDQSNEKGLLSWLRSRKEKGNQDQQPNPLSSDDLNVVRIAENLDLLPAGGSTKSPTEALTSDALDVLISHLKEAYDIIIFDTPPAGIFPDATLLADFADTSIYVARQKKVARAAARHGISLLDRGRAPVVGVVLNGITTNPTAGQSGYGNYGYGQYGGYGYGYNYKYTYQKKYQKHYASETRGDGETVSR